MKEGENKRLGDWEKGNWEIALLQFNIYTETHGSELVRTMRFKVLCKSIIFLSEFERKPNAKHFHELNQRDNFLCKTNYISIFKY